MVELTTISNTDKCREIFEKEKARFEHTLKMSVILSHFGYFSQDLVNGFTESIEEILISSGEKKQTVKRVFSILIEGLQNIRFHGKKDESGKNYGLFFLAKNQKQIGVFLGSLIGDEDKRVLENRLVALNELTEDEVKEMYMNILSNGEISVKGNAGLGFITMRMKSKSKLNFCFHELSGNLFLFTVEINLIQAE